MCFSAGVDVKGLQGDGKPLEGCEQREVILNYVFEESFRLKTKWAEAGRKRLLK